jgi:hypothetical protein
MYTKHPPGVSSQRGYPPWIFKWCSTTRQAPGKTFSTRKMLLAMITIAWMLGSLAALACSHMCLLRKALCSLGSRAGLARLVHKLRLCEIPSIFHNNYLIIMKNLMLFITIIAWLDAIALIFITNMLPHISGKPFVNGFLVFCAAFISYLIYYQLRDMKKA